MVETKVIGDYTYLWYDVRPHPNFGTVEIRVMDSQTRVEQTLALAALVQAMVKELCEHFESGEELSRYPYEMLDENKWLAARHGLGAQLVDLPKQERVPVPELTRRVMERLRPHAEELARRRTSTASRTSSTGERGVAAAHGLRRQPRPPRGRSRDPRRNRARAAEATGE
jgi:gamma-glutamyl:cysteine ligase YbdK (ATP-grasp superfamily)